MQTAVPLPSDVYALRRRWAQTSLRGTLLYLNGRTPHRFTGVFRFDEDLLRCVELVDKWDGTVRRCDDIPVENAYCAHLQRGGKSLNVTDGRLDPRVPWMAQRPIVSYCGVAIETAGGTPWGALCHFDLSPCQSKTSDLALLTVAARLFAAVLCEETEVPPGLPSDVPLS